MHLRSPSKLLCTYLRCKFIWMRYVAYMDEILDLIEGVHCMLYILLGCTPFFYCAHPWQINCKIKMSYMCRLQDFWVLQCLVYDVYILNVLYIHWRHSCGIYRSIIYEATKKLPANKCWLIYKHFSNGATVALASQMEWPWWTCTFGAKPTCHKVSMSWMYRLYDQASLVTLKV